MMKRPITSIQTSPSQNSDWTVQQGLRLPPLRHVLQQQLDIPESHSHTQSLFVDTNIHYTKPVSLVARQQLLTETSYFPEVRIHPEFVIDQWIYEEIRGLSLGAWTEMTFQRDPNRVAYGENTAKRAKLDVRYSSETDDDAVETVASVVKCCCGSNPCRWKSPEECRSKMDHAISEKDRRCRHGFFQQETDKECGECHFDMAAKYLSRTKRMLGQRENPGRKCNSIETGKDLQLFASFIKHKMDKWIMLAYKEMSYANQHGVAARLIDPGYASNDESYMLRQTVQMLDIDVVCSRETTAEDLSSTLSKGLPRRTLRPKKKMPAKMQMVSQPTPPLSP